MANKKISPWIKCLIIISSCVITYLCIISILPNFIQYDKAEIEYVSELKYYQLSKINGEPTQINIDDYYDNLSSLKSDNKWLSWRTEVFPSIINEEDSEYFFYAETVKPQRDYYDRFEIYLCRHLEQDEFNLEKHRLKNITGPTKSAVFSEDLFNYPCVMFEYNYFSRYEYVLFNEENFTVYYIWIQEIGSLDNVVFDKSIAPQLRLIDSDLKELSKTGGYSLSMK